MALEPGAQALSLYEPWGVGHLCFDPSVCETLIL